MTEADISFVDEVLEAIFRRYPNMKTRILEDYGLGEDWKNSSVDDGGCCDDGVSTHIAKPDVSNGTGAGLSTRDLWSLLGISPEGSSSADDLGGSGKEPVTPGDKPGEP